MSIVVCVFFLAPLAITSLKPYTLYSVRLAAMNAVGLGQFSDTHTVRTHGIRKFYMRYDTLSHYRYTHIIDTHTDTHTVTFRSKDRECVVLFDLCLMVSCCFFPPFPHFPPPLFFYCNMFII